MKTNLSIGNAFTVAFMAAAGTLLLPSATLAGEAASLLAGKVVSSTGEALAGIPIKARRNDSNITIAVYTDARGEYSFPGWSALTPGSYSVGVELPDFEGASKPITLAKDEPSKVDFTLKAKPLAYEDATNSEILQALPGTDHQKVLFAQCGNCHTLQWALAVPRPREDWVRVIKKMAGQAGNLEQPGTYAFSQKQFIEPLADYLVSIRGPESSDKVPFTQRPRPTDAASTNLVVTEYALPRGGKRELYMIRGDAPHVWPHDVITNDKYAYYTDHFSFILGRVDLKTGETIEMPFEKPPGAGRDMEGGDGRPGNPGGGAHELQFDSKGNVIIGMAKGLVKYDPKTGQFNNWAAGHNMFGLDGEGKAWFQLKNGELASVDTNNPELRPTVYVIPKNKGIYDVDTDSKGRTNLYVWRDAKIAHFDPKTVTYSEYPTPTPMSGPRRGQIDGKDRLWAAEFYAGQVAMFDPETKTIKEYPLINGNKPYTAPYAEPYTASADSKYEIVWTNDFSSSRLYRIDMNTGKSTEYMTPTNYEMRYMKADTTAPRPTLWIPAYRPPSKMVKIEVRN